MLFKIDVLGFSVLLFLLGFRTRATKATNSVCNITRHVVTTGTSLECVSVNQDKGYECGSLQAALELAAQTDSIGTSCTLVDIGPGVHKLSQRFTLTSDVVIRGSSGTHVLFQLDVPANASAIDPLPSLRFKDSHLVTIEGVVFNGSRGYIEIENVEEINVINSTFRYFVQGALGIYNFHNLTVSGCVFEHNGPASFIKFQHFVGHSGGMSITLFNYTSPYQTHALTIRDSIFINNSALPEDMVRRSSSEVLGRFIFTGRGGAVSILLADTTSTANAKLTNCTFEENSAFIWGGGIYTAFDNSSRHFVVIDDCLFRNNWSMFGSGALNLAFFGTGTSLKHSSVKVFNTIFEENAAAIEGGAIIVFFPEYAVVENGVYNFVQFGNCSFIGNTAQEYASAIVFNTLDPIRQVEHVNPTTITDCKFINNSSPQSATIGLFFIPISFHGHNIFDNNMGGAIQVAGSLVHLHGQLDFMNHKTTGTPDGALSLISYGQLLIHRGTRIKFINNTGVIGAAISVESLEAPNVLSTLVYNPLCFLRFEDPTAPPDEWDDVEVLFDGNFANEAPIAVVHLLNSCSWVNFSKPFFNASRVLLWDFVKFGENINQFHAQQKTDPQNYVQSDANELHINNQSIDVYPGETFDISLTIIDEINNTIGGTVRLEGGSGVTSNPAAGDESISFEPAALLYDREDKLLRANLRIPDRRTYNTTQLATATAFFAKNQVNSTIQVSVKSCPPGYTLMPEFGDTNSHSYTCQCNSANNPAILTCENEKILFVGNLWASKDGTQEDLLFVYPCPAGYCKCELSSAESLNVMCIRQFNHNDPDDQCACGRQGVMCGECSNSSYGVSALLNNCVNCHDAFGLLIVVLIIFDVIICILLLRFFLKTEYPTWIFPCVFYIQVLPYVTENFGSGFGLFRPYLYYISSALSFYFLYDFCLFSNMSALVSYTLRFIPAVVITITTLVSLAIVWHYVKKLHNKQWHLVWLLLLLVYPHTLHTSVSILNCPTVAFNNTHIGRWFVAGHVTCFTGGHAALGVFAIVVLILCALVIPISFILSVFPIEKILWLKRLSKPANGHFKDEYRWWYSVELGRRCLLVLMTVPFPQNIYPSLFSQCVLMVTFLYIQPYKSTAANIAEAVLSTSTIIMLLLSFRISPETFPIVVRDVNSTCSNENSIITLSTWACSVLYYSTLLVSVAMIVQSLVVFVRRKTQPKVIQRRSWRKSHRLTNTMIRDPRNTTIVDITRVDSTSSLRMKKLQLNTKMESSTLRQEPDGVESPV